MMTDIDRIHDLMTTATIKEAADARRNLESSIAHMIAEYEARYGLHVECVGLDRHQLVGRPSIPSVRLEVELR